MHREIYHDALTPLVEAALRSEGLLPPNEFNLARYSPHVHTRNRLLDPDVLALEDYLIDHAGDLSDAIDLIQAFGDVIADICYDESMPMQIGYQHVSWLLVWLHTHYLPSFFEEDPHSKLQILQMAAALGFGEWAAAYNQIEEGLEKLLGMSNSALPRVCDASVLGLQRLLTRAWERSMLRLRYQMLIANAAEWRSMVACWCDNTPHILDDHPERLLDVLDMLQAGLRFLVRLDTDRRQNDAVQGFITVMNRALVGLVLVAPEMLFAQMQVWALWNHPDVKDILRANLANLPDAGWSGDRLAEWSAEITALETLLA